MKAIRYLYLFFVAILVFVLAVPAQAFPAVTYHGEASGSAIDIALALNFLTVPSSASVVVAASKADLDGMASTPVTTSGGAISAEIFAGLGAFLGLDATVNEIDTTKTYQDAQSNPVTDAAGLAVSIGALGTLSVDASAAATNSLSELAPNQTFPTTMDSDASSEIEDTDIALVTSLLTTDVLTSTSRTETTAIAPDHDVVCSSAVTLTGVMVDLTALGLTALGIDDVITADVITANTNAISDGTLPSAFADADYGFVNLAINGTPVVLLPPPQVIVLATGPGFLAKLTIAPIQSTSTSATSSAADAVALRIEVLVTLPALATDVVIDLGTAHSLCGAASGGNTGPTVIDLVSLSAASPGMTPIALFAVVGLALASVFLLRRSKS